MRTVLTSTSTDKVTEGYRASLKQLEDFRAKYADQPAAALAGLYQAELHRRLDELAKATPLYEAYIQKMGADSPHAFMAYEGAGFCYEQQGKLDERARLSTSEWPTWSTRESMR